MITIPVAIAMIQEPRASKRFHAISYTLECAV